MNTAECWPEQDWILLNVPEYVLKCLVLTMPGFAICLIILDICQVFEYVSGIKHGRVLNMPRFSYNKFIIVTSITVLWFLTTRFVHLGTSQLTILSFLTWVRKGIYNSRVTKPSYKTELRIMTSQTELLTVKFYFFKKFFELVTRCEKKLLEFENFRIIVLEL